GRAVRCGRAPRIRAAGWAHGGVGDRPPEEGAGVMRAFVVDDEPLAIKRLARLLEETGRITVAGASTDPVDALAALNASPPDVLFLDIQMPCMSGFEMLGMLDTQPLVVFTTAFDQYALQAFEVNSID